MLLRTDFRSWLYAVDKGATSMWERWDAIRHDGSIHTGAMDTAPEGQEDSSMISFNHYAYGAVVDWIYRNVAGISGSDGFRQVSVQPTVVAGMTYAKGKVESRYGTTAVEWQLQDSGVLEVLVQVPFGVTASLTLPTTASSAVLVNGGELKNTLGYGSHRILVTNPQIIRK
jgi:alpha-L-rhamnosidase